MMIVRFFAKLFLKMMLIPVWLLLFAAGLAVRFAVNIYGVGRAAASFILTLLLFGVIMCYQDWLQAMVLIVLYLILFAFLFIGAAVEVILEQVRDRVSGFIFS